ncbi:MAG: pectinacetylesterase family protein [Chloroflexi bacterium]|nr:pectinacetylesterase family protein [Chloroflexota bacterium]
MLKFNFLAALLLIIFSPLLLLAYGLLRLFARTHEYKGSFPRTHRWYVIKLPADAARCSDGSPYSIYVKKGTTNKLIVYFSGGGLAWDEYTAARPQNLFSAVFGGDSYYFPVVNVNLEFINGGILAPGDPSNPFNDWNCVFIPYATGDCHVGDNEFPYHDRKGRKHILYHHGAKNVQAALAAVKPIFGSPEQLIVAGESAGAIGCVAQAQRVAEYLGCPRVAVYSDSGVIYTPKWQTILRDVWKVESSLADCVTDGNLLIDWFRLLYQRMGDKVVYLQYSSSHDGTLSAYQSKMNDGVFCYDGRDLTEFHQHLQETVTTLAREIPTYRFFMSELGKKRSDGSTFHTAVRYPWYYSKNAQGISLAAWLNDAVNAGNLYNVGESLLADSAGDIQ